MMELTDRQSSVMALENIIKQCPQVDLPLRHFFIPGVYVRAMFISAGYILTGAIHNHECLSIIAKGRILVADGESEKMLTAGDILSTPPGIKRAGFALEDTIFITVHRTDLTDVEQIEDELVCKNHDDYQARIA